ncbi:hypothetical protein Chor_010366 [Crotalus horridus]
MRRLLNDSTGRIYQRVGKEGEMLKEEPQDLDLAWTPRLNPPADTQGHLQPLPSGTWNELSPQTGPYSGQYGTRSKTFQNQARTVGTNGGIPVTNASSGSNCCTCNCQPALQAILQELKTMRKIMQIQAAAAQNRQQPSVPPATLQKSTISRKRNKKKKTPPKTVEPLSVKQKAGALANDKKLSPNSDRPMFTEKYCTVNHVDKLPGPRDWVQILQDQIKLARRRLKRGSAETADGDEKLDISLLEAGSLLEATPSAPVFH